MVTEFQALIQNKTWILVACSSTMNILGSKWVLKTKHRVDGTLEHCKARLMAKAYHQQPGLDSGFKVVVALVGYTECLLYGNLEEDVFMQQLPGFVNLDFPSHICKFTKVYLWFKASLRAWLSKLTDRHALWPRGTIRFISVYHTKVV